jgi:hypothetical protein
VPRGGLKETLDAVPLLPLTDGHQQPGSLELANVIAEPLAGEPEGAACTGGGVGLAKMLEDPAADRIDDGGGLLGIVDDDQICLHDRQYLLDRNFCQLRQYSRLRGL